MSQEYGLVRRMTPGDVAWRALAALLILALVLRSAATQPLASPRAQPELLALAAENPEAMVGVIVQQTGRDATVAEAIARLGGGVTADLRIINALAARLPARQIPALVRLPTVRWVSLDAPVHEAQAASTVGFTTWATETGNGRVSQSDDFNSTPISAGRYIWFSGMVKANGLGTAPASLIFDNSVIQFVANGVSYSVPVPGAVLTFDPTLSVAKTKFDVGNNQWLTSLPANLAGKEVFLAGVTIPVSVALPGSIKNVSWAGRFTSDTPGLGVESWKWAAAVYTIFSEDYGALGVKPCKDEKACQYQNDDPAGTPENFKAFVIKGARGSGGNQYVGSYTSGASVIPMMAFTDGVAINDSPLGPNGVFGFGSRVKWSFAGFDAETTPGYAISKVEVVVHAYVAARISTDIKITPAVAGLPGKTKNLSHSAFDAYVGAARAGLIYLNISDSRAWRWGDFDNDLELVLDQSGFKSNEVVFYDAIGLRVTAVPGVDATGDTTPTALPKAAIDVSRLINVYNQAVRATTVWNEAPAYLQGQGVTVAVVDSGSVKNKDLGGRLIKSINLHPSYHDSADRYGHGTFVATIIGGDGKHSNGRYIGVAPKTNIINVRVSDDQGMSTESVVVSGLQWIYENRDKYNIRAANLSLNSSVAQSYHTSPLCAAVEMLWFKGIVMVVSAGNNGTTTLFPPANDPWVITVGAADDQGTVSLDDDVVANFSAFGVAEGGLAKPELVAPGRNVAALLGDNRRLGLGQDHQANRIGDHYFRMSGTSMAAPMVSAAVALLLQDEPNLTPDQVKFRLMASANRNWPGYDPLKGGAGYLDIYAAVHATTSERANAGIPPSQLVLTSLSPAIFGAVNWNSVNWNSVNWNSVNWNSVNWNSVNWNSVNWNSVNWNSDYWESSRLLGSSDDGEPSLGLIQAVFLPLFVSGGSSSR